MSTQIPTRPTLPDSQENARWLHSALRHRMLDGEWEQDGNDMLENHLGEGRREAWGVLDMSANPLRQIAGELAVLYTKRPAVTCSEAGADGLVSDTGSMRRAGLWTKMKELQRYAWALREYFVRVDVSAKTKELQYRLVSPHNVVAVSDPDEPDRPIAINELRLRELGGQCWWTWDRLSISDPENPTYTVTLLDHTTAKAEDRERDITEKILGGSFSGAKYPYRREDGAPLLPYPMYHVRDSGKLWNPWDGIEVVIGALNAAVFWTFAGHAARDASGRTVLIMGAEAQGIETRHTKSGIPVRTVTLEPGTMMFLEGSGDGQKIIQEVGPGAQVVDLEEFANRYERRVAVFAGINPSDIQRLGGDARSGYAIAISNQGKRIAQEEQVEMYRRYDLQLLETSACISNRLAGTSYPEHGYNIEYAAIPKTPEEQAAEREEIEFDVKSNVIAPWQVVKRRRPGLSDQEAQDVYESNRQVVAALQAGEKAADGALNGAQISAALEIAQAVKIGEVSRNAAIAILQRSFAMDAETARRFVA